jgi:phosphoribosyl-AMP cyclohydrolase
MKSFDPQNLLYNTDGLIPVIAQDAQTKDVLMMAWMNAEAVQRTLDTKKVTYWSRSRQAFWVKGETSGHTQELVEFRYDCDQDCILVLINQSGPACHTNRRSCFYRSVSNGIIQELMEPEK